MAGSPPTGRPAGCQAPCPAEVGGPNGISAAGLGSGTPGTGWPPAGGTVCGARAVADGPANPAVVAEPSAGVATGAVGAPTLHEVRARPATTVGARRDHLILMGPGCFASMTGS